MEKNFGSHGVENDVFDLRQWIAFRDDVVIQPGEVRSDPDAAILLHDCDHRMCPLRAADRFPYSLLIEFLDGLFDFGFEGLGHRTELY